MSERASKRANAVRACGDGGCDLAVDGNRETSLRDSSCSVSVSKVAVPP